MRVEIAVWFFVVTLIGTSSALGCTIGVIKPAPYTCSAAWFTVGTRVICTVRAEPGAVLLPIVPRVDASHSPPGWRSLIRIAKVGQQNIDLGQFADRLATRTYNAITNRDAREMDEIARHSSYLAEAIRKGLLSYPGEVTYEISLDPPRIPFLNCSGSTAGNCPHVAASAFRPPNQECVVP